MIIKKIAFRIKDFAISHIFQAKLDLSEMFGKFKDLRYAIVKIDTPYTPRLFPKRVAFRRDIDVFCLRENLNQIIRRICRWASTKGYYVVCEYTEGGAMLYFSVPFFSYLSHYKVVRNHLLDAYYSRGRCGGVFLFSLDIKYSERAFSEEFIRECLENISTYKGYNVLDDKYEVVVRYISYKKDKSKKYHLKYVHQNKQSIDKRLLEKAKNYEWK